MLSYLAQIWTTLHYISSRYTGNASVLCEDVNECDATPCPVNATCSNTVGTYQCVCQDGYSYNSITNTCDNINECLNAPCVIGATCADTIGSFTCTCTDGACDSDPCAGSNNCSVGADCVTIDNGYKCQCASGFSGEVKNSQCADIDECELNLDNCHTRAKCLNIEGSYTCDCKAGFAGKRVSLISLLKDYTYLARVTLLVVIWVYKLLRLLWSFYTRPIFFWVIPDL